MRRPLRCCTISAALAALLVAGCGKAGTKTPAPRISNETPASPEMLFSEGRAKISSGEYAAAAEVLCGLDVRGDAPAPSRSWVSLFAGLAELLAGREAEARAIFAKLAERTKADAEVSRSAAFYHDVATRLADEKPVPSNVASRYDRQSSDVIALYLYALKNEQLGAFDDALTFHRQFATATAMGLEPWIGFNGQLKQFRQASLELLEYEDLVDAATRARNSGKSAADRALTAARAMRQKLKRETKLLASLDERLGEKVQMTAAEAEADAAVFPPAKKKWEEFVAKYDFAAAQQAIYEPKVKAEAARKEQDMLGARTGNLERFKFHLVLELGASGSNHPLVLKSGTTAPGFAAMDDTTIQVREGGEVKPVSWSEVEPESIYALAKSLIKSNEEAEAAAARKWHLGNFAAHLGKMDDARALLEEAAKQNPAYADELPIVLGTDSPSP